MNIFSHADLQVLAVPGFTTTPSSLSTWICSGKKQTRSRGMSRSLCLCALLFLWNAESSLPKRNIYWSQTRHPYLYFKFTPNERDMGAMCRYRTLTYLTCPCRHYFMFDVIFAFSELSQPHPQQFLYKMHGILEIRTRCG